MWWFIATAALLAAAGAGMFQLHRTRGRLVAMTAADRLSIPELEQFREVSDELGARGGFRRISEVAGAAHPHPDGPLQAELSRAECVWYRYRVERHYEEFRYRDGKRERKRRTEKVAEHTSWQGFAVIDDEGRTLGVDPNGTEPDHAVKTVDRFEPHRDGNSADLLGGILDRVLGGGDGTIGYKYTEWIIPVGQRLYVLGEVHDRIGPLVIGKPSGNGHFVISTRTEQQLRDEAATHHARWRIVVLAGALLGLVTLVAGIVDIVI
ncbi:E3 ubiquitin ligase family protein [Nocardia wallacei]|uniref:E3 ubiquitin ligase family protein n=1 Tax=Nocardia TaxID=1817 RepID=UPI00245772D3|nr:E3 ubiquitin ligase family protein [Nocardia wallacei]